MCGGHPFAACFYPTPVPGQDGSPDTAEDIRNKLELLTGDERLKIEAIRGLPEAIDTVRTTAEAAAGRVQTPAKAYRVRQADLSSQCDGAKKSFNVGGTHFGIIGVFSTEFPNIYRPIIDYTETATGFTLTSQVSAPASGQTLTALFLK